MTQSRRQAALSFRKDAADLAASRPHPQHLANSDEQRYAGQRYAMSFTKGLQHDATTGLLSNSADFVAFRAAIDNGFIRDFTENVPVPIDEERRLWEAPTAGVVFELEGPDPQALTMPPAPALGSSELTYEMAEVYELAVLRDVPFTEFAAGNGNNPVKKAASSLNKLDYTKEGFPGRPRLTDSKGEVDRQTVFRGASPGVEVGPYLSQFMLIGSPNSGNPAGVSGVQAGRIQYGTITIDQKTAVATPKKDFMQKKEDWLRVQRGFVPSEQQSYTCGTRFISTPRDLATYVHFDALYEAYLNAALILLGMPAPFDPGFAQLSGQGRFVDGGKPVLRDPSGAWPSLNAGGFALFGGPHILSLVTEVATRALKAVRYQKFNVHIRLRPETLAGRIACANQIKGEFPELAGKFADMAGDLSDTLKGIEDLNNTATGQKTHFLPMAFAEGSPMHPAYGAGHATVAGACVTVLKAFFDTDTVFVKPKGGGEAVFKRFDTNDTPVAYVSDLGSGGTGETLVESPKPPLLTLEGELNKLAANISIGRNMAGVHYFTDYYDSVRMGEEIAIGILEEQALGYTTDPFVLSVPTFDGETRRIGAR
ncbi:MAG: vanadium-dependent haloperoxidase [Pseudomonadota bacterium]